MVSTGSAQLSPIDKITPLTVLHNQHLECVDRRRLYEWKMSLSFWTGIGFFTWFFFSQKAQLSHLATWAGVSYVGLALVYIFVWSAGVAIRQLNGLSRANYYRSWLEVHLVGGRQPESGPKEASYWEGLKDFASVTKAVFTLGLLALSWLAVWS